MLLVRVSPFENHSYKEKFRTFRTKDLKCCHMFESPGKALENINAWFLSQRFQLNYSKERPRPPYSLNSPNVQQGLKITALCGRKIEAERLFKSSLGQKK